MKIGFFDSGLGGLSIFNKALDKINANYIYLADNKNAPYGIKSTDDVIRYVLKCIDILVNLKCEIIVVACNSATSIAINEVRKKYKNVCIIGTEPAVKVAVDEGYLNKKILVSATTLTLREEKLNNLIKNLNIEDKVEKVALDKLVTFAESGQKDMSKVEEYLKRQLKNYNLNEFSHLVLGCTHFPLYMEQIKNIVPNNIHVIDGSDGVVNNLSRKIIELNLNQEETLNVKLLLTKPSELFVDNFKRISNLNDLEVCVV